MAVRWTMGTASRDDMQRRIKWSAQLRGCFDREARPPAQHDVRLWRIRYGLWTRETPHSRVAYACIGYGSNQAPLNPPFANNFANRAPLFKGCKALRAGV